MKAIIRRWTAALFTEEVKARLAITERQVFQAATLQELDDVYTRKLAGFETVAGEREKLLNMAGKQCVVELDPIGSENYLLNRIRIRKIYRMRIQFSPWIQKNIIFEITICASTSYLFTIN